MRQVICMKWGSLYGAEYVNRLFAMVRANLTGELRFVCLTDNAIGIRDEIECFPCDPINLPPPYNMRPWRKINLWASSEKLFGLTGNWLFLDLDVVITDNLDPFFDFRPEASFVVMYNWTRPGKNIGNTSCYRFTVGAHEYIYNRVVNEPEHYLSKYSISQAYVSGEISEIIFWPDEWVRLFKLHSVPKWPMRFWKTPSIPKKCKVLAFPGDPNPPEAVRGEWPVKKKWKKIYKHIRPTPWIEKIWESSERHLRKHHSPDADNKP